MPPAVIAGGIAAVGAIGGAVIGSKAQSKATDAANDASQYAAQMQYQLGQESLALNKDIYNSNFNILSPTVAWGNVARDQYGAMLGLSAPAAMQSPLAPPPGSGGTGGGSYSGQPPYTQAQINAMWNDGIPGNAEAAQAVLNQWLAANPGYNGGAPAAPVPSIIQQPAVPAPTAPPPTTQAALMSSTAPAALAAPQAAPQPAPQTNAVVAQTAVGATPPMTPTNPNAKVISPLLHAQGANGEDFALPSGGPGSGAAMVYNPTTGKTTMTGGAINNVAPNHPAATPTPAPAIPAPTAPTNPAPTAPTAPVNALTPTDAFETFANSAGAQQMLKASADSINNLYAAKGALNSGAAMKAIDEAAQLTMMNNYLMPYMGMVGGMAAQGAQAGSAIAGVGSSFGNTAAGINGQIGGAYQNSADAAANAAIANGMNQANMWNSIGGAVGGLASSFVPVKY